MIIEGTILNPQVTYSFSDFQGIGLVFLREVTAAHFVGYPSIISTPKLAVYP